MTVKVIRDRAMVVAAVCLLGAGIATAAKSSLDAGVAPPPATSTANWHARYGERYKREFGVDIVGVRRVSSGYMLRFSYRVLDPVKAAPLLEKKVRPYLFDKASGARMAVPAMENIGELRQTGAAIADRTYYVIFGNPGGLVKSGGNVRVVIGNLDVDDLIVD